MNNRPFVRDRTERREAGIYALHSLQPAGQIGAGHNAPKDDRDTRSETRTMATLITKQDLDHMRAFPVNQKTKLIQEMMIKTPMTEQKFQGNTHCARTILRLRADGLRLIDLQSLESAFSSIWYKRGGSLLQSLRGRARAEVAAMVVWECVGGGDVATVRMWRM